MTGMTYSCMLSKKCVVFVKVVANNPHVCNTCICTVISFVLRSAKCPSHHTC